VQLRTDAVVLVLDPDGRRQARERLGLVDDGRGEHDLERMEEREPGALERVLARHLRGRAEVAGQHAGPLDRGELAAERARDPGLEVALAQPDAELAGEDRGDVATRDGVAALEDGAQDGLLRRSTTGGGDRLEGAGDLGERQRRRAVGRSMASR
jgi:hypothetical protein